MPSALGRTTMDLPDLLRDRLAALRRHPRQPYHEVVEAAVAFWCEHGGWGCPPCAAQEEARRRYP